MDMSVRPNLAQERYVVRANASMLASSMGRKIVWENTFRPRCNGEEVFLPNPGCILGDHRDYMLVYACMVHEIGHANFTDFNVQFADHVKSLSKQMRVAAHALWNVIEDIFIERAMSRAFPGVASRLQELAAMGAEMKFWEVDDPEERLPEALVFALLKRLRVEVLQQDIYREVEDTERARMLFGPVFDQIVSIAMNALRKESTVANVNAAMEIIELLLNQQEDEPAPSKPEPAPSDEPGASDEQSDSNGGGDSEKDDAAGSDDDVADASESDEPQQGDSDEKDSPQSGSDADSGDADEGSGDEEPGSDAGDSDAESSDAGGDRGESEEGSNTDNGDLSDDQDASGGTDQETDASGDTGTGDNSSAISGQGTVTDESATRSPSGDQVAAILEALDGDWDIETEMVNMARELYEEALKDPVRARQMNMAPFAEDPGAGVFFNDLAEQLSDHTQFNMIMGELGSRLDDLLLAETQCRVSVGNSGRRLHRRRMCHLETSASVFARTRMGEEIATAIDLLVDVSGSTTDRLFGTDGQAFTAAQRILAATDAMSEIFSRHDVPMRVSLFSDCYRTVKDFDESWVVARRANQACFGGGTETHQALQLFAESLAMREEARKLLVLVTDGDPGDRQRFAEIAEILPELGIELRIVYIGGIASGVDANEQFYRGVASTEVARSGWDVSRAIYDALASDFDPE